MKRALLVLLVVAGCQSELEQGPSQPYRTDAAPMSSLTCDPRSGLYRMTGAVRDGTCGPFPETIQSATAPRNPACTYRIPPAGLDACRVEIDFTCPLDGMPGWVATTRGAVQWDKDASKAAGILFMQLDRDGALQCAGTYNVTVTKL